jgi:hypothetical protein
MPTLSSGRLHRASQWNHLMPTAAAAAPYISNDTSDLIGLRLTTHVRAGSLTRHSRCRDRDAVRADWHQGGQRGVKGAPHFFCGEVNPFCPLLETFQRWGASLLTACLSFLGEELAGAALKEPIDSESPCYSGRSESARRGTTNDARKVGKNLFPVHRRRRPGPRPSRSAEFGSSFGRCGLAGCDVQLRLVSRSCRSFRATRCAHRRPRRRTYHDGPPLRSLYVSV